MARTRWAPVVLLLALLACAAPTIEPEVDLLAEYPDLHEPLEQLRSLYRVEGKAVGFSGGPGRFWEIYVVLRDADHRGLAERLLAEPEPACRSMGLLLLANERREESVPVLSAHLDDRGPIEFRPMGCVGGDSTVAAVALGLLHDRTLIESDDAPEPLMEERELLRLDLELLARDGIAEVVPDLSRVELVKALGRLLPDDGTIAGMMTAIAADPGRPDAVRRAATSALTRAHEAFPSKNAPALALHRLSVAFGWTEEPPPQATRPIVLDLSARLDEWSDDWNTWSDTPWLLEDILDRYPTSVDCVLTEREQKLVRDRIRRAIDG